MTDNGQSLATAVLVDTSALFAITNEPDDFHGAATAIVTRLQ